MGLTVLALADADTSSHTSVVPPEQLPYGELLSAG